MGEPLTPPQVSIVVCVYDMAEQAKNTLYSLSTDYQRGVTGDEYEVIVVENASANTLDTAYLRELKGQFRYFLREEPRPTPVYAMNEGAGQARAGHICVMIDGARMLSPGVVSTLLKAHRVSPDAIVSVPGYHLGTELQQEAVNSGYSREQEAGLLAGINWPEDGYRLFDIACFSGSCSGGFFRPHAESNCLSLPLHLWQRLGGFDPRFDARGGGLVNLDLYRRACELPESVLVLLPGEGSFHQFHGGITTGGVGIAERQELLDGYFRQYREIRGKDFKAPWKAATMFGVVAPNCQRFVVDSAEKVLRRRKTGHA